MCFTSSCSSSSCICAFERRPSARLFYSTSISVAGNFLERSRSIVCILALRALAAAYYCALCSSWMRLLAAASTSLVTLAPCLILAMSEAVRTAASRVAPLPFLSISPRILRSSSLLTMAMLAFVGIVAVVPKRAPTVAFEALAAGFYASKRVRHV